MPLSCTCSLAREDVSYPKLWGAEAPLVPRGGGALHKPADLIPQFGVVQDEEGCTRRCIQDLQAVVLELLSHGFWEWGLRCTAPPSPMDLCANAPPGRLPFAAPSGIAHVCRREGWGTTPPLHFPDDCPLPPRSQGNRRGVVATSLPLKPPVRPMLTSPTDPCSTQRRSGACCQCRQTWWSESHCQSCIVHQTLWSG